MANLRARDMIDVAHALCVADIVALKSHYFNSAP